MMKYESIKDVRLFWEENPLFKGESDFEHGTAEYFKEHRKVVIEDCFAGCLDRRLFPKIKEGKILDLGCGPGFWTVEMQSHCSSMKMYSADLTHNALLLARNRIELHNLSSRFVQANAEELPFNSESFDYVNCQGVIHHTPETGKCIKEIARILKPDGKALVSVYYKNAILRNWSKFKFIGRFLMKTGAKMKGRGRDNIFYLDNEDDIIRLYDGIDNPVGKAYTRKEFATLLSPYFNIEKIFYHLFPARAFPFKIPKHIHRFLDRKLPFMIYAEVKKRPSLL
ncbi:MAG: class I SAM-dependent methyltransferase [Bacteroidetes bacterium]|nr:class I SAM-dependent methyltransferase [Bacteroidota bacterium]